MKRLYFIFSALLLSNSLMANNMPQSFNDAREIGKSSNANAQEVIKNFQPQNEFKNFNSAPQQSQYYTGVTGSDPNMNAAGLQELNSSTVGNAITTSTINNPRDKISENSDFIQNSVNIQKNAAAISGIDGKGQCVNKVLSKTSFNTHYCERDQAVNSVCTITDTVKWSGSRQVVDKELVIDNSNIIADYNSPLLEKGFRSLRFLYDVNLPQNITITGYDFNIDPALHNNSFLNEIRFLDNKIRTTNEQSASVRNLSIISNNNKQKLELGVNIVSRRVMFGRHVLTREFINRVRNGHHQLKIFYKTEEDTLKPMLEKVSNCNIDSENSIELSSQCTKAGGTRNVFKDGKTFEVTSDCWETTITYLANESSDNECRKYEKEPNCTVAERECLLKNGDNCVRFREKYQCSTTVKTDGYVCGDKFFCSDGSCADLENSVNTDFGHAVSQLAALAKAGEDVAADTLNLRAFTGKPYACRKSGFGFSDCCKDSGWGNKAGLAHCNSEEKTLGRAKERNLVIYVGTYCDKKVLKKCIRRKSSYCVFDNKLARIVQAQGRSGQLGIGFGDAKNPNCRGITVEELQSIKFDQMDYSDFYSDLEENQKIPDKDKLIEYMRNSITDQMQQK